MTARLTTPEIRELFRTPPEGFVAARDALVRRLREEGREVEAGHVKRLRRPTVAAWALDRLADERPDGIRELIDVGAEMMRAQRHVLSGRDPQVLRDTGTRRREVVARLTKAAADLLREAGRSPDPHLEDIQGTLERASVDEEVGQHLRGGVLERTLRPAPGFGEVPGLQLVPGDEDAGDEQREGRTEPSRGPGDRRRRALDLDAEVRRLKKERDAADRRLAAAEDARDRTAKQVGAVESRLEAMRERLREADAAVGAQRLDTKRAARAFEIAERKLRDMR